MIRISLLIAMGLLAHAPPASAQSSGENGTGIQTPACIAVLEFTPGYGVPESGKMAADIATRALRQRGVDQILERHDLEAFLSARRLTLPSRRDVGTVATIGRGLQTSAVLDGIVVEYADGTGSSDGLVAIEVILRLIDASSKKVIWEGSGRATSKSLFRFRRRPLAEVADEAIRRALDTLSFEGPSSGSCPKLASTELVSSAAERSIVANAPSDASTAPLRIVRSYSAPTGEERTIDISEVRVLHFNAGGAELKPGMEYLISEIASVLRDNPDLRLIVEGHTDAEAGKGPAARFDVSFLRAKVVYDELRTKHSIDPKRMLLQAAGEKSPVAANDSPFNRTLNRRVEFKFLASNQ